MLQSSLLCLKMFFVHFQHFTILKQNCYMLCILIFRISLKDLGYLALKSITLKYFIIPFSNLLKLHGKAWILNYHFMNNTLSKKHFKILKVIKLYQNIFLCFFFSIIENLLPCIIRLLNLKYMRHNVYLFTTQEACTKAIDI